MGQTVKSVKKGCRIMENFFDKDDVVLYTINDIQRIFKLGRTKAYQLVVSEGFPSIRLNRKIYVPKDKLQTWVKQNTGKAFRY